MPRETAARLTYTSRADRQVELDGCSKGCQINGSMVLKSDIVGNLCHVGFIELNEIDETNLSFKLVFGLTEELPPIIHILIHVSVELIL